MAAGRPTDYRSEYCDLAFKYCLLGAKDAELAQNFDISESTLNNWKIDHPEFMESIKNGREKADAEVSKSLYKRATGYDRQSEKIMQYQGVPVVVPTTEHIAPDPTAAQFWLKNRRPADWRDRQDINIDVSPISFVDDLAD